MQRGTSSWRSGPPIFSFSQVSWIASAALWATVRTIHSELCQQGQQAESGSSVANSILSAKAFNQKFERKLPSERRSQGQRLPKVKLTLPSQRKRLRDLRRFRFCRLDRSYNHISNLPKHDPTFLPQEVGHVS